MGTTLGTYTSDEGRFSLLVPDTDVQLDIRRGAWRHRNVNTNLNFGLVHSFTPATLPFSATTSAGIQRERRELDGTSILARGLIPGQSGVDQGSSVTVTPVRQVKDLAYCAQEELRCTRVAASVTTA